MQVPTPAIRADSCVRRLPDALSAEINGETVLMSVDHGRYFTLDAVGSDIWARLEEPVAARDLVMALAADYMGDPAEIEADVLVLLNRLADLGLLESVA